MRGSEVKDLITSGCNTDNDTSRWSITTHRSASAQLTRIHNQKRTPLLLLSPPLSGDLENQRKCVKLNSSYLVIFVSHFKHQPQIVTKSNIKVLSHTVSTTPKIIIQKKKIRKEKRRKAFWAWSWPRSSWLQVKVTLTSDQGPPNWPWWRSGWSGLPSVTFPACSCNPAKRVAHKNLHYLKRQTVTDSWPFMMQTKRHLGR